VTVYLDSSSLVKLYVDEPGSDEVLQLVQDADVVVTSILAYPEVTAALARRRRDRLMTPKEHAAAQAQFDADWPRCVVVALDGPLSLAAGTLAAKHRLRGADAAHLAAFEVILGGAGADDVRFSCADDRLTKAARALG